MFRGSWVWAQKVQITVHLDVSMPPLVGFKYIFHRQVIALLRCETDFNLGVSPRFLLF